MSKLNTEMKHVILIREDLPMSMGKFGIQVHHACFKSIRKAKEESVKKWSEQGIKTILLSVPDTYELIKLYYELDETELPFHLTIDLGITEFTPSELLEEGKTTPVITAMGIGPAPSEEIDKYTKEYGLYKPNEEFLEKNFNINGKQVTDVMKHVEEKRSGGW